jgi:predicted Zn finger-like uncharacterized protein
MRIVCPSCNATYEVPAPLLGSAPRRLRCARCQREWSVSATGPAPAPAVSPAERPAPPHAKREATARDQTGPMARLLDGGAAVEQDARIASAGTAGPERAPLDDDPFALEPAIRERLEKTAREDRASLPPPLAPLSGQPVPLARPREGVLTAEKRPRPISETSRRGQGAGVALAWVLSVAVLCVCIGAAFVWRADIMRLWPPSERIYLALGLR